LSFLIAISPSWASDPNIVIINSYHYGQEWADNVLTGIMEELRRKYPDKIASVEYLDTKRFQDQKHMKRIVSFLADKYAGRKIDLVMALDNPALDLLIDNRPRLFSEIPIVFAGINNYSPDLLKGYKKITGIAEVTDIRGSIETILHVTPRIKRIVILNDYTVTGLQTRKEIEKQLGMFRNRVDISFIGNLTFEEMQKKVNSLPTDSALLIASFVTDSSGKALSIPESTQMMVTGNNLPVYAMYETRLGRGALGGYMLSGAEHGRRAGQIALRVLSGEDPSSIPVDIKDSSVNMFDYNVMKRLGISMAHLPEGSKVINRPVSFIEEHKTAIITAMILITLLLITAIILLVNIMRRRKAEMRLLEMSRYTSALFEEARDAVFVADPKTGVILDVNRAAEKLLKRPKSELVGLHQSKLHPPEIYAKTIQTFGQQSQGIAIIAETHIINGEGGKIPVEISPSLIELPNGRKVLMGAFRDISERNRLQEQLFHAQKMEAVGTLAGGVAHEFNNALTAIIGATELLRMELPQNSSYINFTNMILGASQTAARLTQNLLSFCRKQIYSPQHIDINIFLKHQEKLILKLIGENIQIIKKLSDSPCPVFADPGQIAQIIMNIAMNAKDAMPSGGALYITTELVTGRQIPEEISDDARLADYVLISFRDTGYGIDPSIRSKIFEPFFTTKEVGKGTGLGLSIVYGIVTQNNGFIDLGTEPGHGTEFRIFLPRSIDVAQKAQTVQAQDRLTGNGAVLLAEDNESVRHMQRMILKSAGYDVFEAADGKSAVELFHENTDLIDIVVLDVVMPGMDGKVAYDQIKKMKPEIKILLVSGHTGDIISSKGIDQDRVDFLAKPFSPAQLLKKIRDIMQRQPSTIVNPDK
jgi:two-component system, cell cycle sensor histidine kinase and response regulator CckA